MPKCKRCGNTQQNVCEIDTDYEDTLRKELKTHGFDLDAQMSNLLQRVSNKKQSEVKTYAQHN